VRHTFAARWLWGGLPAALLVACGSNPPSIPTPTTTTTTTPNDTLVIQSLGLFPAGPKQATARLVSKSNSNTYGVITFRQSGDRVSFAATIFNVPLGPQSIYIHENGNCSSPNAASAGPVWQLPNAPPGARRAGDLPLLIPGTEGNAAIQGSVPGLSVGDHTPTDLLGRAVVVHSTVVRDPKPEFGGRPNGWIACGVIQQE